MKKNIRESNSENLEITKLREEIHSLKIQTTIAILTITGTFIAALAPYINSIYKEYCRSIVQIIVDDTIVKQKAIFTIVGQGATAENYLSGYLNELPTQIRLPAGTYSLSANIEKSIVFQMDFYIKKREKRTLSIPTIFNGSIQVYAKLNASKVYPGMILPLIIQSSADGYLWIYEINNDRIPKLLFPNSEVDNSINAFKQLNIPAGDNGYINAGDRYGEETILFIVTKQNGRSSADFISTKYTNSTTMKASGGIGLPDYGTSILRYSIE